MEKPQKPSVQANSFFRPSPEIGQMAIISRKRYNVRVSVMSSSPSVINGQHHRHPQHFGTIRELKGDSFSETLPLKPSYLIPLYFNEASSCYLYRNLVTDKGGTEAVGVLLQELELCWRWK